MNLELGTFSFDSKLWTKSQDHHGVNGEFRHEFRSSSHISSTKWLHDFLQSTRRNSPKQTCFYHFLTQKDSQTQHKRLLIRSQAIREKLQQPGQGKNLIAGTKAGFAKTRWISIEFGERNVFFCTSWNQPQTTLFFIDGTGETPIFPW